MQHADIFAFTSSDSVAIAATRAGAIGLLDLDAVADAEKAIKRLEEHTTGPFGVRITSEKYLKQLSRATYLVVNDKALIASCKKAKKKVLFETTTAEEAPLADGIILKESEATSSFMLLQKWHAAGSKMPFYVQGSIGRHTAAACIAAGASGVVLDSALLLAKEARYNTISGVVDAVVTSTNAALSQMVPFSEESPLAKLHKTRFPIVQGPMTRVSDTAEFAKAVSDAGALPIHALAVLRGSEVKKLLEETKALLPESSWGVGILGFLPQEIRREQIDAVLQYKPTYALIAGGRPDQAQELEKAGIPTYIHVPTASLLKRFLQQGCRRFVFEGRECGGHVGPNSSFVLWEAMVDELLQQESCQDIQVLFAGGIHDALSSACVAAISATLQAKGIAVGCLMGTAYLFTKEAVASRAIVKRFQKEALSCTTTHLLQTGPGHAIRCIKTPYCDLFDQEKGRMQKEGLPSDKITQNLEMMNMGRLRIASKGVERQDATTIAALPDGEQYEKGMYMIGEVAALRDKVVTMKQLHEEVCTKSARFVKNKKEVVTKTEETPSDIAIIGMACFYPGAATVRNYWLNILAKKNVITEIPKSHWDWQLYYDPNPRAADKIISKWGGFLSDIQFDPLRYGITPNSLYSIEPLQLFLLEAVRTALHDSGYSERPFNREKTCAILGIGGAGSPLAVSYGLRCCMPLLDSVPDMPISSDELLSKAKSMLPEWTEDSFPGILLNVAAGRVANRFNFGGLNFAIDAACGSSLAAVYGCIQELENKNCDVAVAMAADTVQTPYSYMAFSKTHALSPRGKCTPFDAEADGIVLSEGIGAVILKRLADAERDGDKIYAVIKGMGASSDGKEKGLTAPTTTGQLRALTRAYRKANIDPAAVGLIEAHGTGTVVGDQTEVQSMCEILNSANAKRQGCALGSVKSMIGHAKCAAGLAGLIKTALALHYKILPPTLVNTPNPKANFKNSPLYLNTEAKPWIHEKNSPRIAGVSAFGFGGTNFHAVLSEYKGNYVEETDDFAIDLPESKTPLEKGAKIAFIRSSIDAVKPNMLHDVAIAFAELREAFDELPAEIASYLYPQEEKKIPPAAAKILLDAAYKGLSKLLKRFGITADFEVSSIEEAPADAILIEIGPKHADGEHVYSTASLKELQKFVQFPQKKQEVQSAPTPSTWLVNSTRAKPLDAPEPHLIGQMRHKKTVRKTAESDQMLMRFQDLMGRFLEMQKSVMTSYLQGGPLPAFEIPEVAATAPPPAPVVAEVKKEVAVVVEQESVVTKLLTLVSKRTGYPVEMLGLDLNLEADLGVDSIKRIEILSDLSESLGATSSNQSLDMEKLTTIMTLRGILDYLSSLAPKEEKGIEIDRGLVQLVDAAAPKQSLPMLPEGTILFTDDGRGVAKELMMRLADFGVKSAFVDDQVEGSVSGIIHLAPLGRDSSDVKSLYLLAKQHEASIRQSSGALLFAATAMGGTLGVSEVTNQNFSHGGISGFIKSIGQEWPEVVVRAIDFHPESSPTDITNQLLEELTILESPLEVGYFQNKRLTWSPVAARVETTPQLSLSKDDTILITGGARGITAQIAIELARKFQVRLVLVGRSKAPLEEEDIRCTEPADIKAEIMRRLKDSGAKIVHADVEKSFNRILQDREIRTTLQAIERAGSSVSYHSIDVRDDAAFTTLIQEIGPISGVIHGAGVIEDRYLRDKTPESFDRVYDTKVQSARTLMNHLNPETLKFLFFFASIASRYGNTGQSDYAAANEVLSKMAIYLDAKWKARVASIAWGPWSGVGMVAELQRHLEAKGLKLIKPEVGANLLINELLYGKKGDCEVIIAGGAEHIVQPIRTKVEIAV